MGIFDFIGDLVDIGKDIIALPGQIADAAKECATDIGEVITQDIQNKVNGTPDKPIRTSFDIRDEAQGIIVSANRNFNTAESELRSTWHDVSKDAEAVAEKRENVYRLLGQAVSSSLTALPKQPSKLVYPSNAPYLSGTFDVGTYFGILGAGMRMDAAEEYLQEAKEYRVKVDNLVNQVKSLQRTVLRVSDAQTEEIEILDIIQKTYRARSEGTLSQSAGLLHDIAVLYAQEFRSNTDKKYGELLQKLKSLWN